MPNNIHGLCQFNSKFLLLHQGCLLTQLVKPSLFRAPFENFEDIIKLLAQKRAVLDLQYQRFPFYSLVKSANSSDFVRLREALRNNPPIFSDRDGLPEDDGRLVIVVDQEIRFLLSFDRVTCDQTMIPAGGSLLMAFPLNPMNHTVEECLNRAIDVNIDRIHKLIEDHYLTGLDDYQRCRRELFEKQTEAVGKAIRLIRLSGNFVLWILGLILASFAFLVEFCRHRYRLRHVGRQHVLGDLVNVV